jgi:ribosomal protein L6P/L9E
MTAERPRQGRRGEILCEVMVRKGKDQSRIGKKPIVLPPKVEVTTTVRVSDKGPKGTLSQRFNPDITIAQEAGKRVVTSPNRPAELRACMA